MAILLEKFVACARSRMSKSQKFSALGVEQVGREGSTIFPVEKIVLAVYEPAIFKIDSLEIQFKNSVMLVCTLSDYRCMSIILSETLSTKLNLQNFTVFIYGSKNTFCLHTFEGEPFLMQRKHVLQHLMEYRPAIGRKFKSVSFKANFWDSWDTCDILKSICEKIDNGITKDFEYAS
uniref:Uncharacterized protein n=1 Tax=Romanomermis culicivorax TaxID=13658 RepID=A0A915JCN5_ROMCU